MSSSGCLRGTRLLPTEYLVVLLDEDEEDDAMLIEHSFVLTLFLQFLLLQ